jgi:hypothetical protein
VVVGASVAGSVVAGGSVDVEVVATLVVVEVEVVDVVGSGVLGGTVVGLVLVGSSAVDGGVDVDVTSGGAAVRPAHAATVNNAASAHARNLMQQYYYDKPPLRRDKQPVHRARGQCDAGLSRTG